MPDDSPIDIAALQAMRTISGMITVAEWSALKARIRAGIPNASIDIVVKDHAVGDGDDYITRVYIDVRTADIHIKHTLEVTK